MSSTQRTFGQFETPADVADLLLGFCVRRPSDRFLDPSCGRGAFLARVDRWRRWLADKASDITPDGLWGVELDPKVATTAAAALPDARILNDNFFTLDADEFPPFDVIIGNPPYTRAEWIARLHRESGRQLALALPEISGAKAAPTKQHLIPRELWAKLDGRSGLHAYFFLHCFHFLREGGRLGFVVPNGWLDVAYGQKLKRFLLDHFRIIALIESGVERWFRDARVNTCLVLLEKCDGVSRREANLTRLIRLKRPLADLIPGEADYRLRPVWLEQLATRLLPSQNRQTDEYAVRVVPQGELRPGEKWGVALRAPAVYRQRIAGPELAPLQAWATVKRGFTTGANAFFYLSPADIERWQIEPRFRRPVLKSLRDVNQLRIGRNACHYELFTVPEGADLRGTAAGEYVAWGESQGYPQRRTCAGRHPWYGLPQQGEVQLVLPKGIWQRHFAPLLEDALPIDQQLYGISLSPEITPLLAAALLNSAWFALQCELQGRINFGEGVLWLATYETGAIRLPDPRLMSPADSERLQKIFLDLARRPLQNIETELDLPDRQALDSAIFEMLGFSAAEGASVIKALRDRVASRLLRARALAT